MDLLERVKDKIPADKLTELQEWFKWCEETAERYTKEIKGKLAFELGAINPALQASIRAHLVAAMREAGRHIVTTKLCDTVKTDPGDGGDDASAAEK